MTDVTNGGLRGDAFEMAETANCRIVIDESDIGSLVQPQVKEMLEALKIDYLGVSLDSLLVVAPFDVADEICRVIRLAGVTMKQAGHVEAGKPEAVLRIDGKITISRPVPGVGVYAGQEGCGYRAQGF